MVIGKRRVQYEQEIEESPKNYDIWFDYAKLEESAGDPTRVREVYERAIAQVPPADEKRFWRRYIYLWINYALYEELESQDTERTRQIYEQCIQLIPHKKFTFAKIWLMYAQFEIRQMQVAQARKLLGRAIGMCPKNKLFKGYIDLEFQLREFDRCRTIYTKYLEYDPSNCSAWIQFAELEKNVLDEVERCRAIFELAVSQENLNMPELLWKAYIDFEIGEEEYDKTRDLYYRLLERTEHVKVYISFAQFELSIPYEGGNEQGVVRARKIFEGAYNKMKEKELKEEVSCCFFFSVGSLHKRTHMMMHLQRVLLLEAWKDFEENYGDDTTREVVQNKMPKVVKKRRRAADSTEDNIIWEEYFDYIFADDQEQNRSLKVLQMARAWQKVSLHVLPL